MYKELHQAFIASFDLGAPDESLIHWGCTKTEESDRFLRLKMLITNHLGKDGICYQILLRKWESAANPLTVGEFKYLWHSARDEVIEIV